MKKVFAAVFAAGFLFVSCSDSKKSESASAPQASESVSQGASSASSEALVEENGTAALQNETGSEPSPLDGKMYAFSEEVGGMPSFQTIEFKEGGQAAITFALGLEFSRVTGPYLYDAKSNTIFIKSSDPEAEAGYQAVLKYDEKTNTIMISDEYGNLTIFEEVKDE